MTDRIEWYKAEAEGQRIIDMLKIGCGLDRLKWNDVEQIIKDVFADTDVEILVCDWR